MRALVMDFRNDVRAQNIGDQFMFGPAILVNPVTEPAATTRHLYLPQAKWYDFWTGASVEGKREIAARAPLDEFRSTFAPAPSFPWDRTSNSRPKSPPTRSSCASTVAQTASSRFTKTRTTTTTTRRAFTPPSLFAGTTRSAL